MLVRVRALLAAVLFLATALHDRISRRPAARRARAGRGGRCRSPAPVPADRWRAVLIAGDNNSPAFDNGVEALRDKLAGRGVRNISVLTSDPAGNPSLQVATAANVSSALRSGGGEACLVFITSHGDESGVVPARRQGHGRAGLARQRPRCGLRQPADRRDRVGLPQRHLPHRPPCAGPTASC